MKNTKYSIDELLFKIEEEIKYSFSQTEPKNLYEPIKYLFEVKGKRLRPLLTILATGIVGGNIENALKPAVSFELLHNFTLIHDDIMDKSPTRRGRETIHNKWDEAIGILSGDLLLALAYRKIIVSLSAENCQPLLKTFTDSFVEVCEGQGFDIDFENQTEINEIDYFKMIDKKTAKLIEKALVAGGQIGNASLEQITYLSEIGKNLGLGFQLQDDLLDLTATSDKFGKEIGKDIQEGKKTFIMIKAKEIFSNLEDIELLNKFYTQNGLKGEEVRKMIESLHNNGIFEIVQEKINLYFSNIHNYLDKFEDCHYKSILESIIDTTFKRDF
jgi:geranylgeranyl diphosphate synthase type II